MKKSAAFLLTAAIFVFAQSSLWAVWEGNAGVGSAGSFPGSGMYVLSDMFPKNTMVDIRNLETGLSARAVVVGKSGVPGLVASVSPEVAGTLNIQSGSVSRVRISVPLETSERTEVSAPDSFDRMETLDPDLNPAAMVAMESGSGTDAAPAAETPETAEAAEATPDLPSAEEENPVVAAENPVTETGEEIVLDPAPAGEVASSEEVVFPEEVVSAEETVPAEESAADSPDPFIPEAAAEETAEVVLVPAEMNPPVAPEIPPEEAVPEVGPVAQIPPEPAQPDAPVPEVGPVVSPETAGEAEDRAVPSVEPLSGPETGETAEQKTAPVVAEEKGGESAAEDAAPATEKPDNESVFITEYLYVPEEEPVVSVPAPSVPADSVELAEGYYVQIGSYTDSANVQRLVASYSGRYPLAFVDAGSGGVPAKKVLVGKLDSDETGAVLEFFRKEGFRDAFVFCVR